MQPASHDVIERDEDQGEVKYEERFPEFLENLKKRYEDHKTGQGHKKRVVPSQGRDKGNEHHKHGGFKKSGSGEALAPLDKKKNPECQQSNEDECKD